MCSSVFYTQNYILKDRSELSAQNTQKDQGFHLSFLDLFQMQPIPVLQQEQWQRYCLNYSSN